MLLQNYKEGVIEAGCDEAGRGPLAGPVFAAAVILPQNYQNSALNDSKKLNEKTRAALREQIEKDALAYHVSFCSNEEIDQYNILNASILAMHRALDGLCEYAETRPEFIIIDGNKFKDYPCADINIFLKSKFHKSSDNTLFNKEQIPYTT
ncbi:MAG: ribonuclease HII, partial [Bacteroidales bacterium]|nr:ribonuclease HII [Bacteroidales bacterium]